MYYNYLSRIYRYSRIAMPCIKGVAKYEQTNWYMKYNFIVTVFLTYRIFFLFFPQESFIGDNCKNFLEEITGQSSVTDVDYCLKNKELQLKLINKEE